MKKFLCLFLTMLLLVSAVTPVMASGDIKVQLGGELIKFDVQPQLINNRTMVPLRAIFEALGATVDWNGDTQTVTSTKGGTTISLTINKPTMYVNGEAVTLDSPACLVDGRTLVPVRAISEAFKLKVEWIASTWTVKIKTEVAVPHQLTNYLQDTITEYVYDENGNLVLTSSNDGNWTKYTYNENGDLIYYEQKGGWWEKYSYNEKGQIALSEFESGVIIESIYNEKGQLILEKSNNGNHKRYTYDENGWLILEDDDGFWSKYTYDERGRRISFENAMGSKSTCTYDEKGNLLSEKFNGYTDEYSYDAQGLLSTETRRTDDGEILYKTIYKVIVK